MDALTAFRMKLDILSTGLTIDPAARAALTQKMGGEFVEHDYVSTGGLTLRVGDIYVNSPVDEWYCDRSNSLLELDDDRFVVRWNDLTTEVEVVPLPGYIQHNRGATPRVMTHADRIRISPIDGCACNCTFCDWPATPYLVAPVEELLAGLKVALADGVLPARHLMVSGGTPRRADYDALDDIYRKVVAASPVPVDVMLMPRPDVEIVDALVDAGVHGFSINLEIFSEEWSRKLCPQKHALGLDGYAAMIERAVAATGGNGRVRSLIMVGLEPMENTLEGVEFLAKLGCDPVLSPFRPAPKTALADQRPATAEEMYEVWARSVEIVERYGVKLGPRCIPCAHNTITFPDDSGAYYYS